MDTEDRMAPSPPAQSLTVTEAADRLGLSRWTISGWISSGRLPAVMVGRRRRLPDRRR